MIPEIQIINLDTCHLAQDTVVAIDVCRAFTTAAYAFSVGADRILLVGSVEEALALKKRLSGSLVMGEVDGNPVPEFDLWNSPAQFSGMDLHGQTIIQRTTAGTQGIVRATAAKSMMVASLVVAGATARYLQAQQPAQVALVCTGWRHNAQGELRGEEDLACAEYLRELLTGQAGDVQRAVSWVKSFRENRPDNQNDEIRRIFEADIDLCAVVNRFDFAMRVDREADLLVMRPVKTKNGN